MDEGSVPSTILKKAHTGINQVNGTPKNEHKFKDKTFGQFKPLNYIWEQRNIMTN